MKAVIKYTLIFVFVLQGIIMAQNPINITTKTYVKKSKVLIRLGPKTLKDFELIKVYTIRVERFLKSDLKMTNPLLIHKYLKPFDAGDTLSWLKFYRKDKNMAAFLYQYINPNKDQLLIKKENKKLKEKEDLFKSVMLVCDFSADAAASCGLLICDSTIENNTNYVYRLSTYNNEETKIIAITSIDVNTANLTKDLQINDFSGSAKKNIAKLKLNPNLYSSNFSGYTIEKSRDNIHFYKVNTAPIVPFYADNSNTLSDIIYKDTLLASAQTYYYRIKGINFFGEESEPSNIITLKNYREIKSYPNIDSIKVINNQAVFLKWAMLDKTESPLIKKYILARSNKDAGEYNFIYQTSSVFQFIDRSPLANNFYKVFAITEYGDTLKSYSRMANLSDTIPPAIPKNLKAVVDKKGNVKVTWAKNKEVDFKGYRIFKANTLSEDFIALNEKFIIDTFYTEKLPLNNLAHHLYYALEATDATYNSSQKCEPFKLRRPDTIAPVKPIITDIKLLQHGVKLFFSPSKSEDVELHSLIRSNIKDQSQKTILQFLAKDTITKFIDTSAVLGESYTYSLIAFDEDENKSISFPRHVTFETGFRPIIKEFAAKVDLEKRRISLNWIPYNNETEKYILYRASEKEPYTIIKTLTSNESSFIDKDLNIGNVYFYKIKAVLKNGAESILNQPIKVIF